jgi:hypothetical protein
MAKPPEARRASAASVNAPPDGVVQLSSAAETFLSAAADVTKDDLKSRIVQYFSDLMNTENPSDQNSFADRWKSIEQLALNSEEMATILLNTARLAHSDPDFLQEYRGFLARKSGLPIWTNKAAMFLRRQNSFKPQEFADITVELGQLATRNLVVDHGFVGIWLSAHYLTLRFLEPQQLVDTIWAYGRFAERGIQIDAEFLGYWDSASHQLEFTPQQLAISIRAQGQFARKGILFSADCVQRWSDAIEGVTGWIPEQAKMIKTGLRLMRRASAPVADPSSAQPR